jgi:hypothetical protein
VLSFLPLSLMLAGYTVSWYGWTTQRGVGMGIKNLILPSQVDFCNNWLATPKSALSTTYGAPQTNITGPTNSANGGNVGSNGLLPGQSLTGSSSGGTPIVVA